MKIDSNINDTRIAYENPLEDELTEVECRLYEVATQEVENTLAAITMLQERRKGRHGQIHSDIYADGMSDLRDEMGRLEQSLALVELLEWMADGTYMSDDSRETIARALLNQASSKGVMSAAEVNSS